MEWFIDFFEQLLEMSITASVVILAVLLVRFCLRRLPKKYSYLLWVVVLFRLICPVSVSSGFSIFNFLGNMEPVTERVAEENMVMSPDEEIKIVQIDKETVAGGVAGEYDAVTHNDSAKEVSADDVGTIAPMWLQITTMLWLLGIGMILIYSIYTYWKFRRKVAKATLLRDDIYECGNISSPFVMGIVSPKIYIPYRLGKEEQKYILAHERYHIVRCDYLVKIVAFLILTVYWFHPLVWISYFFMCRDMEMSCDEKVLSALGNGIKRDYSILLLSFATNKRLRLAGPLAFGEGDTGKRVKNVLRFRQPKVWGSALGIALLAVVVLGCATNEEKSDALEVIDTVEKEEDAVEVDSDSDTTEIHDELLNAEVETGEFNPSENAVTHNDPAMEETVESADPEALEFIQDWMTEFCGRDGTVINEMVTDEGRAFMEENFYLTDHGDVYSMGWSSPWPMNAATKILSVKDGKAEILLYAWESTPRYYVWKMELAYEKTDGAYKATPKEIFLDSISSTEELFMVYPGGVIKGTPMDFLTNGEGEILNQHAVEGADSVEDYAVLFSPETAAVQMLNIDPNKVRTRVVLPDSQEQGMTYVVLKFGDGTNCYVEMIQPYGEDGVWIPQDVFDEAPYEGVLEE